MIFPQVRGFVVSLFVLIVLGWFVATRFHVVTDITYFLPEGTQRSEAELARHITDSELSRTMVLAIRGSNTEAVTTASRAFESALRADPRVAPRLAFLEAGPPADIDQAIWELYQPRRWSLVAPTAAEARHKLSADGLQQSLADLKRRLGLPLSPLLTRVAPEDPLLTIPTLYESMEATRADGIQLVDNRFVSANGRQAILFLGTRASAFDAAEQAPLLTALDDVFEQVASTHGGALELAKAGVNRHAVHTEAGIKRDITRVSVASIVAIVALFAFLFRSPRYVAAATLPIGVGMLGGLAACLLVFEHVHSLTLAFGAALIGVCIDYAVHFYCHHSLDTENDGPLDTLRRIWPGIFLGALTTVVGFVALGWSQFPGLQEVAVFASTGILAALASTRLLLPWLVPARPPKSRALQRLAQRLLLGYELLRRGRRRPWALVLVGSVIVLVGLPRVQWDDDLASMQRLDTQLVAEDELVYRQVARVEQRRFVLAVGSDDENALQANDAIARALEEAVAAGELDGFRNIARLLPSAATQRSVADVVYGDSTLRARMASALQAEGFVPQLFEPFFSSLTDARPEPLTYPALAASPLAPLVRSFRLELGDQVAFLSFLSGVSNMDALANKMAAIPGARVLDQGTIMRDAYAGYRDRIAELLAVGLLGVMLILALRYRQVRTTAAALMPAVVAATVTIAVLGLVGVPLSILTLTALLMVLSIGVDYGVFLVESQRTQHNLAPTLCSLLIACLSTVLGFGLLAWSSHPALHALGLTACVGVFTSFLLAPTGLVLLGRRRPPSP